MPPGVLPRLSVVIPAHNAAATLDRCLEGVRQSERGLIEVVVVDDGSTDGTADIARSWGATLVRQHVPSGPAAARNTGAKSATAEIILFVDADIVLAEDAIPRVLQAFETDHDLAAVFGSYDDQPAGGAFVSDYRNLLHHFVHQTSREESGSFWAGCGAVRKATFFKLGGFDERYHRPSIEDIELGSRLARAGDRVRLDKSLRGTHLKRWTLARVVLVDIRDRAYPWARHILQGGRIPADLNLRQEHRLSAALVWLNVILAVGLMAGRPPEWRSTLGVATVAVAAAVVVLNRRFYRFLAARRGLWFAAGAFFLHVLYYAYASATFAWCWASHRTGGAAQVVRRYWRADAAPGAPTH